MNETKLTEIENFWKQEVHYDGYDDIVDIKQMARTDTYYLMTEIKRLQAENDRFESSYNTGRKQLHTMSKANENLTIRFHESQQKVERLENALKEVKKLSGRPRHGVCVEIASKALEMEGEK